MRTELQRVLLLGSTAKVAICIRRKQTKRGQSPVPDQFRLCYLHKVVTSVTI